MATNTLQRAPFILVSGALLLLSPAIAFAQTMPPNRAPALLVPSSPSAVKSPIQATPAPAAASNAEALSEPFTPSPEFQQWITDLTREHLPNPYEKTKNWGKTTKVWDGLKITTDNGRLSTKRRWKQANDGLWQRYQVKLLNPEERFEVRIENIRPIDGGKVALDVQAVARLDVFGRWAQWEHGVQLISLSAEADATVRLAAQVEVQLQLDASKLPPDVLLVPEVRSAKAEILHFRLRRLSDAHGPLVKSLSASVREVLEDKLAEQNRGKLAASLNKQLAKQHDQLRLGVHEALDSPWASLLPQSSAR